MKKYIAFIGGQQTSSVITKEKAIEWAKTQLGNRMGIDHVKIAEITDIVERTAPVIQIIPFSPTLEEEK